jgi:hypothetical protein
MRTAKAAKYSGLRRCLAFRKSSFPTSLHRFRLPAELRQKQITFRKTSARNRKSDALPRRHDETAPLLKMRASIAAASPD